MTKIYCNNISDLEIEFQDHFQNTFVYNAFYNRIYKAEGYVAMPSIPQMEFVNAVDLDSNQSQHSLIFELTQDCNFRCYYCAYSGHYANERTHSHRSISKSVIYDSLHYIQQRWTEGRVDIGFYGGEPLLRFDLLTFAVTEALKIFPRERLRFSFTTNLSLLKNAELDFLYEHNFIVNVSLDFPLEDHSKYRRSFSGQSTLDTVLKNFRLIRERYPKYYSECIGLSSVLCPPYDRLIETDDYLLRTPEFSEIHTSFHFVDQLDYNSLKFDNLEFGATWESLKVRTANSILSLSKETVIGLSLFRKPLNLIHRRSYMGHQIPINGICLPGSLKLFVSTSGYYLPCERVGSNMTIGDSKVGIDNTSVAKYISQYVDKSQPCLRCWASKFCGLCFSQAIIDNQMSESKKAPYCDSMREYLLDSLQIYVSAASKNLNNLNIYFNSQSPT